MLSPDVVRRRVKESRKGRSLKPCFPCKQRKVKCDDNRPCRRCVERSHADLCSYEPPEKSRTQPKQRVQTQSKNDVQNAQTAQEPGITVPPSEVVHVTDTFETTATPDEKSESNTPGPPDIMLGEGSMPNFVRDMLSANAPHAQARAAEIRQAALPMLGLQTFATSQFLPLWDFQDHDAQYLWQILPKNDEIIELFSQYKHGVWQLWPFLVDLERFESRLATWLQQTSGTESIGRTQILRSSFDWAALLFAVLAVGLQSMNRSTKETRLRCRRLLAAASCCLSLAHSLVKPSLDSVQALVLMVQVLANGLFTESAWALLGLASRQAQSMGLHVSTNASKDVEGQAFKKLKLWWTIMWQDSVLSMCFDRLPATAVRCADPWHELVLSGHLLDYQSAMYALTYITLESCARTHGFFAVDPTYEGLLHECDKISQIKSRLREPIGDRNASKTLQDHMEYHCFQLHSSCCTANLLRPSLSSKRAPYLSETQKQTLSIRCLEAYKVAFQAYVDLLSISTVAKKSWAFLHNGLSAALILAITDQTRYDPAVIAAQDRLFKAIQDDLNANAQDNEFWLPHKRGFLALQKLRESQRSESFHADEAHVKASPHSNYDMGQTPVKSSMSSEAAEVRDRAAMDYVSSYPQAAEDLSFLFTENANTEDLGIDDILNSVLWGDYQDGRGLHI